MSKFQPMRWIDECVQSDFWGISTKISFQQSVETAASILAAGLELYKENEENKKGKAYKPDFSKYRELVYTGINTIRSVAITGIARGEYTAKRFFVSNELENLLLETDIAGNVDSNSYPDALKLPAQISFFRLNGIHVCLLQPKLFNRWCDDAGVDQGFHIDEPLCVYHDPSEHIYSGGRYVKESIFFVLSQPEISNKQQNEAFATQMQAHTESINTSRFLTLSTVMYLDSSSKDVSYCVAKKQKRGPSDTKKDRFYSYQHVGSRVRYVGPPVNDGKKLDKRFLVRGHWRNQTCGPKNSERRRIWIMPHWKGPDGAEIINRAIVLDT